MSSLTFENYFTRIPNEAPLKAAQSFIATAAINAVFGTPINAVLGGAIAVTASLIEAVTRPIIQATFPSNPGIAQAIQIFVPNLLATGLFMSLAPWIGATYKATSVFLSLAAWIALNHDFLRGKNVAMTQVL